MSRALKVISICLGASVQDQGRLGYSVFGVSRSGAADALALAEGAALLQQAETYAAIELVAHGGEFEATEAVRIALTGAPMSAHINGQTIAWNASHWLQAGARLSIGAASAGVYGYLHVGGGIEMKPLLGSRSAHLAIGLGQSIQAGDLLPVAEDDGLAVNRVLSVEPRFDGGCVRMVQSVQTRLFSSDTLKRFAQTLFTRDHHGNRMGVRLGFEGEGFQAEGALSVLSEVVVPGDVQITGDGAVFVLLNECQTTGGYPRIGTVLPSDLPKVAQAKAGARLQFKMVNRAEALKLETQARQAQAGLCQRCRPLIRDPRQLTDLLSYQLISGVTAGDDLEES